MPAQRALEGLARDVLGVRPVADPVDDVRVDAPDRRLGVREPPSAAPRHEMDEQRTERT